MKLNSNKGESWTIKSWTIKKARLQEQMLSNCGAGEDSWESLGQQGDKTSQS